MRIEIDPRGVKRGRRRATAVLLMMTATWVACASGAREDPQPRIMVVDTPPMHLDAIYPSMTGPFERTPVDISRLAWVTAFRTEVIDAATDQPMGGEFLCHAQLQIPNSTRMMVTATGIDEVRFPRGFGMPVGQILKPVPDEYRGISFLGMLLNNHEAEIDRHGQVRATLEYYTDEDVGTPPFLKKLYIIGVSISVDDVERYSPPEGHDVDGDVTTHCVLVDQSTTHWMVPPGTQKTRTRFNDLVPVDSRVHYGVVHLHNHGQYMRLTDVTTGEILWQTDVEYEEDRLQIRKIPTYSSEEGFPVFADHEYELEAWYDNTTDHDVDAMAIMYLYYHPNGDEDIVYPSP